MSTKVEAALPHQQEPLDRKVVWHRSVFWNVSITAVCAFLAPGLYNAMTLTGAGGLQNVQTANIAAATLYALLTVVCWSSSFLTNIFGFRYCLSFGLIGYCVYAAGLYVNSKNGTQWFVIFGAAVTGLCSGVFWATEGAIAMGYPEKSKRGRYLSYWLIWRSLGTVVGASIAVAFNHEPTSSGGIATNTYLVFIVLQALAPFVALLLREPQQIQRPNGEPVHMDNALLPHKEAVEIWRRVLHRKEVILMIPFMIFLSIHYGYIGTFIATYFSSRSRALASLVGSLASILGNLAFGFFVDWTGLSKQMRAKSTFVMVMLFNAGMLIWQAVMQARYIAHPPVKLDWSQSGWYTGWGVYIFGVVMYNVNTNYVYWVMGQLARDPRDTIRLSGFLRGTEAAGVAIGFGILTQRPINFWISLGIIIGLFAIGSVCIIYTIVKLCHYYEEDDQLAATAMLSEEKEEVEMNKALD